MSSNRRDENRVTNIAGVSSTTFTGNVEPAVDPTTHRMLVDANLDASDIEIGAIEIKDGTSDVRAVVGANGLEVDVKSSVLPSGASTSAKQDSILTELQQKTEPTDIQLGELIIMFRSLFQALQYPAWLDRSANAIRNQVQSGTISTVSTVTNLTNFGTQGADVTYRINSLSSWALNVRSLIT